MNVFLLYSSLFYLCMLLCFIYQNCSSWLSSYRLSAVYVGTVSLYRPFQVYFLIYFQSICLLSYVSQLKFYRVNVAVDSTEI